MSRKNPFYPNVALKSDMYPYQNIEELFKDVSDLYNALSRLKILTDWKAIEIERDIYEYFKSNELLELIRKRKSCDFDDDDSSFVPDSLQQVYPSLPLKEREAFLYTLRGLIQEKLGNQ
jgi:hypothetical protein